MDRILVVGLGGFVGAIVRYGLSGWIYRYAGSSFPTGTMAVNVLGCLVIGMLMSFVEHRSFFGPSTRLFLTTGLLGSFTTFSTLGYETFELLKDRQPVPALANVFGNLVLGLGAVSLGWIAVKVIRI